MLLTEATNGQEQGIYKTLEDVSKVSQATLSKRMDKTLNLAFDTISSNKMKQILMSDWSGANWSERLWKDRQKVGTKLTEILEKGVPQGLSLQKMARELKDITGQSYNNAFRLIRTETSHIDGQVTLEGYKQVGKELGLEYYEYDAFLDGRTSELCRDLDKKRFKVSEAEVGVNYPPMHPNCRSTTQLVLEEEHKTEYRGLFDKNKDKHKAEIATLIKGKPMTKQQANGGKVNPLGYKDNCQSCVACYEARLRGYDVIAQNYNSDIAKELAHKPNIAFIDPKTNKPPEFIKLNVKNANSCYKSLNTFVKENQRYGFAHYNDKGGHIIEVTKTNGKLEFYDPQNGKTYDKRFLNNILYKVSVGIFDIPFTPKIFRVDNAKLNISVIKRVTKNY
jgi:SPP1 gp7 family putative phage head morphogenesis protein